MTPTITNRAPAIINQCGNSNNGIAVSPPSLCDKVFLHFQPSSTRGAYGVPR